MTQTHIQDIDLNLLIAFDVLLEERHITNSAIRLNITQPAMSRTLGRLREMFGDPIIVRTPNGYVPTARAEDLIDPIKGILKQIQQTLVEPTFDPATADGEFRVCTLGYGEVVIIPRLMEIISRDTSNVEIVIVPRSIYSYEAVIEGKADILFGARLDAPSKSCAVQPLFKDKFVCIMSQSHPLAEGPMTLEGYLKYPHSIIHTGERPGSYVDTMLGQLGHKRRIQKRSPHWTSSLMSLQTTNLLQTVPERMTKALVGTGNFAIKDLPFELEPSRFELMWHARHNSDPRHTWFRERFIEAAKCA